LPVNLGYACIVQQFSQLPAKKRITTNRTMIQKTFKERGINYAAELALLNVQDLYKILVWNTQNNINFYRMSSDMFPWASEYGIYNLPNIEQTSSILKKCGDFAKANNQRLTFHPGPFNKLTSSNERVTTNTIKDLKVHADIMDLMGLSNTPYNKINIHVGATYKNKQGAVDQFLRNFETLPDNIKGRFTLENDDKPSLYNVEELYRLIHKSTNIPIVFDYHHHTLNNGGMSHSDALAIAVSTWGNVKPVVHYSESRCEEQKIKCPPQAHSDYVYSRIDTYGLDVDIMIEAKQKELALFKYLKLHKFAA
jgi:UV DNA damage endonuclease